MLARSELPAVVPALTKRPFLLVISGFRLELRSVWEEVRERGGGAGLVLAANGEIGG